MKYLSVFVPAARRDAAATVIAQVWPEDPYPKDNLGISLQGAEEALWFGGNMAVTVEEERGLAGLRGVEGIRIYAWNIDERRLEAAFPAGPEVGSAWGWTESLAEAGLHLPTTDL